MSAGRRLFAIVFVFALVMAGCGGTDSKGASGGEERTVLVDYRHDEFTSAFLQYYPQDLKIRQGDTVQFRQAWTGEPHSVTFGSIVDDFAEALPKLEQYPTPADAVAGGLSQEYVDHVVDVYSKLPSMTEGYEIAPAGAEPCYVGDLADMTVVRDVETDKLDVKARCPKGGEKQPAFTGRQALYNSGFIPYSGPRGNSFSMDIAADATPGTYTYFCNYHFFRMSGTIQVVEKSTPIPAQAEVSKQARKEIQEDATPPLDKVAETKAKKVGDSLENVVLTPSKNGPPVETKANVVLPLAGRLIDPKFEVPVIINEFFPKAIAAKVGQKVTWTFDGSNHTVSFNVPKYFPIFRVDASMGAVAWDAKSHDPVGFDVPRQKTNHTDEEIPALDADAGRWDGKGGFHSSGALNPGDTFSVTFTKAGTYPYACVLHPQMVGTVQVG